MAWNIYWISLRGLYGILALSFLYLLYWETSRNLGIFSILGLGCPYLFGIFYIWTWLSGTLGFPTWTTCPNPWDFCLLGEHWHLDFLSELFFFYGLCDRTGRPSIGQRKYSSRGSPLPTRWVRAPLLDWLSICLVIYSSFAPGGAGPAESLLSSYDLSGHGAHRAFKWIGNRESIHHISFFYLGKFIYLGWNLGSSFFIIWKAYLEILLGNLSWNLLSCGEHLILAPPLIHGLGIYP